MSTPDVRIVDERRDAAGMLDLWIEKLDPAYAYRWVSDDRLTIARRRLQGYQPVRKEDAKGLTIVDVDDSADGLIRVADAILMRCKKVDRDKRMQRRRDLRDARMLQPKREVKELAERAGIETTDREEE